MNMQQLLVTSIVPMFNVELYLAKCLESIVEQTWRPLEIIVVDDGSPDRSGEMADGLALLQEEIIVVHESNKWLGGARNTGLDLASGEYISFVDSDDYLVSEAYEKLIAFAEDKQCQVVQFGCYRIHPDGSGKNVSIPDVVAAGKVHREEDIRREILPILIQSHAINGAQFRLYRDISGKMHNGDGTEFRFREELRYAEDYVSCLDWFPKYRSYALLPEPLYYYVVNPESIMNAYNPRRIKQLVVLYEIREEFMRREGFLSQEYLYMSANLLMKLVFDQLGRLVGERGLTIGQELQKLRESCDDTQIAEAAGRLVNSHMDDWGGLGRWALKAIHGHKYRLLLALLVLQNRMHLAHFCHFGALSGDLVSFHKYSFGMLSANMSGYSVYEYNWFGSPIILCHVTLSVCEKAAEQS